MTPTEQDNELREAIIGIVEAEYKMPNYIPAVERIEHIMQLITADRKRVALEARLDEIKRLHPRIMQSGIGVEHIAINADLRNRIAELKDQQEQL